MLPGRHQLLDQSRSWYISHPNFFHPQIIFSRAKTLVKSMQYKIQCYLVGFLTLVQPSVSHPCLRPHLSSIHSSLKHKLQSRVRSTRYLVGFQTDPSADLYCQATLSTLSSPVLCRRDGKVPFHPIPQISNQSSYPINIYTGEFFFDLVSLRSIKYACISATNP